MTPTRLWMALLLLLPVLPPVLLPPAQAGIVRDTVSFPSIISAYYAKEFCSCRFVIGQPEAWCHDYVRQYIDISSFALDEAEKTVTVRGLGRKSVARYLGPRQGCVLE